jgi:very-short-patch-repair endonuclease
MRIDPWFKQRARAMRHEATPAEQRLWPQLRGRRFTGLKFRRQHVIGSFIVDFYCAEASLVLEVDGETHLGKELLDQTRQRWLEDHGLKVLRFWNTEVFDDLEVVIEAIWRECQGRKATRSPRRKEPLTPGPSPLSTGERGEEGWPA